MSWRTVVISNQSKLDYKMGYMVVRGNETHRVHIDEIAVLLVENPAVSLTGCLIEMLIEKKVKVIFCDAKRNPTAELIAHHGSHDSSAKIRTQAAWSEEIKAMIWREIVAEKIRKQSELLWDSGHVHEAGMLTGYLDQIELGDTSNREGHAAKVYFNALFGKDFTRSANTPVNAALNYGYSLILSSINREITAMGYLTQLGIFHDNMFNHFNLGCDLMEPFRIVIDRMVVNEMPVQFEKEEKYFMWKVLDISVKIDGNNQSLRNALKIYTHSVLDAINDGDASKIKFYDDIGEMPRKL